MKRDPLDVVWEALLDKAIPFFVPMNNIMIWFLTWLFSPILQENGENHTSQIQESPAGTSALQKFVYVLLDGETPINTAGLGRTGGN